MPSDPMTHASMLTHLAAHNGIAWEDLDADTARELRAMLDAPAPSSTAAPRSGAEPARGEGASARACWDCAHDSEGNGRGMCLRQHGPAYTIEVSNWIVDNCTSEPLPGARNCPGWAPREAGEVSDG